MLEELAKAAGIQEHKIPAYVRLSAAMERLGFRGTIYIDGKFSIRAAEAGNFEEQLIDQQPPTSVFWQRDDGQQAIQCVKASGESILFWPNAATDVQSQLAALAERFAEPQIMGGSVVRPPAPDGVGTPTG